MYEDLYNVNGSQAVDNYYIRRLPIHLEMAERRPMERGDIVSALTLVLIFMSIMAGREMGSFYAGYDELKSLKVLFRVSEEDMSVYLRDVRGNRLTVLIDGTSGRVSFYEGSPSYAELVEEEGETR